MPDLNPSGTFVKIPEGVAAFVPDPLPRTIELPLRTVRLLDEASRSVATLAGIGETLPNPNLLMAPFLRREAVLSSRIEGTVTSVSGLLMFEMSGKAQDPDAIEVANYVHALERGLELIERLPISVRLLNEVHRALLTGVRGGDKRPGDLRTGQVHIGPPGSHIRDAQFVPPPAPLLRHLLSDLEEFINSANDLPPLLRAALAHQQFETIHPYVDGNGRLGRLLIVLMLCAENVMPKPLLYLSAYFERRRDDYYGHLQEVRTSGQWLPWIEFFLEGVLEQAQDAITRSRRLRDLQEHYRKLPFGKRASANIYRLLESLFLNPYVTVGDAATRLRVSHVGARNIVARLVEADVLTPIPNSWPQLYVAQPLLAALEAPAAAELPATPLPS